jgi:hypothetical protein
MWRWPFCWIISGRHSVRSVPFPMTSLSKKIRMPAFDFGSSRHGKCLSVGERKAVPNFRRRSLFNHRAHARLPHRLPIIQDIDPQIRSRLVDFQVCQVAQMFQVPMYSRNPQVSHFTGADKEGISFTTRQIISPP